MPTIIQDNGASIKITVGTQVRNIVKRTIVEITVIRTNIIKIDIGQGALDNVFIPYSDVTAPLTADPAALRDAINAMLTDSIAGVATEAKQNDQINLLNSLSTAISAMQALVGTLDSKIFFEPLAIDESGPNLIYKGYALAGTIPDATTWAIERIEKQGEIEIHTWANGNKNLANKWVDRENLTYS